MPLKKMKYTVYHSICCLFHEQSLASYPCWEGLTSQILRYTYALTYPSSCPVAEALNSVIFIVSPCKSKTDKRQDKTTFFNSSSGGHSFEQICHDGQKELPL